MTNIDRESSGETQQVISAVLDRFEWHIVLNDISDRGWHHKAPRQVQMPITQTVESRAQIKAQELGDRHAEIRVAMRVYIQVLQARDRLTDGSFVIYEGSSLCVDPNAIVARYRHLIERRYRNHAGISDYAHELGTSEARLRRCCLAVTGQSPVELLHQRLLVEAARQSRYTSMTVTQVAYFLGFEDPAYFSRFFTRRMRMSPRRFRQRQGGSLRA